MNATPHDARMTTDGPSMSFPPWKGAAMTLAVDSQLLPVARVLGTPGRFLNLLSLIAFPAIYFVHGHCGHGQHKHYDAPSGGTPSSPKPD